MNVGERTERQLAKYGITLEAWEAELKRLNWHCPGCRKPFSRTRLPCADHDHKTGMWRGILCTSCNYDLGSHHDNAEWFANMADYINNPPAARWEMFVPGSIGEAQRAQA